MRGMTIWRHPITIHLDGQPARSEWRDTDRTARTQSCHSESAVAITQASPQYRQRLVSVGGLLRYWTDGGLVNSTLSRVL